MLIMRPIMLLRIVINVMGSKNAKEILRNRLELVLDSNKTNFAINKKEKPNIKMSSGGKYPSWIRT